MCPYVNAGLVNTDLSCIIITVNASHCRYYLKALVCNTHFTAKSLSYTE